MQKMWTQVRKSILLTTVLLPAIVGIVARWQTCDFSICYGCHSNQAHCYTNSSTGTVPQTMVDTLTYLEIKYQAENSSGVCLYQTDVKRYQSLESLHLFNDFTCIHTLALVTLSNLTWLHLESTQIRYLPYGLLEHNNKFTILQLIQNQFTEIPFNIFAEHNIENITHVTFHGNRNVVLQCSNKRLTLPTEFYRFHGLLFLDIGYNTFATDNCSTEISDSFFEPVSNIGGMSVEDTTLLQGREIVLNKLKNLRYFDISYLSPYRDCPANASALFDNIPKTVENLTVTHWEIGTELSKECLITKPDVLAGLANLKLLQYLSFGYSDGIFGPTLMRSTIPPTPTIAVLDLSYCRLNSIEKDALLNFPNLVQLNLAGNPLGPKDVNFVSRTVPHLQFISLLGTNIRSDMYFFYDASNILCNFPAIQTIDFSSNDLRRLPRFNGSSACNTTTSAVVEKIFASNSKIETFIQSNISGIDNICLNFPNLKQLKLQNNIIRNLYGLEKCLKLEFLDVFQNHLYYDFHNTDGLTGVLHHLRHMRWLNLGYNGFRNINSTLLHNMPNLTRFYLAKNNIQSLENQFFSRNKIIQTIDLSSNYLQNVHHELFAGLQYLELLDLRGNLISVFSPDFLHMLERYNDLGFFGFGNNPYDCGCNKTYFRDWMKKHQYFTGSGVNFIRCASPPELRGKRVIDYENDPFECTFKTVLIIGGCLLAGIFTTLAIALPCYKYRWYISHAKLVWDAFMGSMESVKLEQICPYDAFVSYDPNCERDCMWVVNELTSAIEDKGRSKLKLYLEHRDALSGTHRYTERENVLRKSKRILIVVSNSYLRSVDCLSEADLSGLQMHGTEFYQPNRVMLLIRENLNEEIIRPPMSSLLLGKTLKVEYDKKRKMVMWRKIKEFLSKPLYTYNRRERSQTGSASYNDESREFCSESTHLLSSEG